MSWGLEEYDIISSQHPRKILINMTSQLRPNNLITLFIAVTRVTIIMTVVSYCDIQVGLQVGHVTCLHTADDVNK